MRHVFRVWLCGTPVLINLMRSEETHRWTFSVDSHDWVKGSGGPAPAATPSICNGFKLSFFYLPLPVASIELDFGDTSESATSEFPSSNVATSFFSSDQKEGVSLYKITHMSSWLTPEIGNRWNAGHPSKSVAMVPFPDADADAAASRTKFKN